MRRRDFLKSAALCALGTSVVGGNAFGQSGGKRPNIVFIMADDLGYGHLGCYGQQYIKTPHIDRLAAGGMRFTQCYSGAPLCAPARSCLMTGMHAGHTPVRGNSGGVPLPDGFTTPAEVLKGAGYATGIFGKWGLGDADTEGVPNKQGFDEFFGYLHQKHAHFYYTDYLWHNDEAYPLEGNQDGKRTQYSHDVILEKCLDWVREKKDEPFYCYLSLTIPHHEWTAPADEVAAYSGKLGEETRPQFKWREGYAFPKEPKANMAGMISHLDKGVGKVVDLLAELGIDDNTLVIFTSDNGADRYSLAEPEFFKANAPFRGYKGDLYEGGIREPGIAYWPGVIPEGVDNDHPWYFADVLPTFAELAGAAVPAGLDGLSFAPTLLGKGTQKRHNFMYWETYIENKGRACRMGDWKAVWPDPESEVELYDLAADPAESTDVATAHPDVAEKMKAVMDREHVDAPPQIEPGAPDGRQYR